MKVKHIVAAGVLLALAGALSYLWLSPGGAMAAPDVTLRTLEGKTIDLRSLRGAPVILTFWATTCPTCVKEIPHLIELHRELGPRGLKVIGVAMAYDPPAQVRELAERREIPYTIALDHDGGAAAAFGHVRLTPTTFVIDPQGLIVQRRLGELDIEALKARLEAMIAEERKAHAVG